MRGRDGLDPETQDMGPGLFLDRMERNSEKGRGHGAVGQVGRGPISVQGFSDSLAWGVTQCQTHLSVPWVSLFLYKEGSELMSLGRNIGKGITK